MGRGRINETQILKVLKIIMSLFGIFRYSKINLSLRKSNGLLLNIENGLRRQMSSKFVERMRLQQKFKISNQLEPSQYSNGLYLIFVREGGLVMISNDNKNLVYADFKGLSQHLADIKAQAVFLNIAESEHCRLAVEFPSLSSEQKELMQQQFHGRLVNLRHSLFLLPAQQSALVSQSRSMLKWRRQRNFCAECGGKLTARGAWSHKECSSCGTPSYPHTSPVGIALVENEDHSQALLVRQPRHPPAMFTCLAGFIDPGESLEQNVAREVAEEVGLEVSHVRYLVSQHWAYPAGRLMLGCLATALPGQVDVDKEELEDAAWFSPAQLRTALHMSRDRRMPEEGEIWLPPVGALAHPLIEWWLNKYHPE